MPEPTERDWWAAALEQANAKRDEWHRQNGLLRGELAAATARAEQAEAALAELRERLGEPVYSERHWLTTDGRETEFDLHNEDGCGCRHRERNHVKRLTNT